MIYTNEFLELQNEVAIITPSSGQAIYIWNIIFQGEGSLRFSNSGNEDLVNVLGGSLGMNNVDKQGEPGESIILNCQPGTVVKILYDEI
jgi:hypothetical protein